MFNYLKGKIEFIGKDFVCLNVNNLGFKIYVPSTKEFSLNEENSFFVVDFIKDDQLNLYGFIKELDLRLFNKLLTVNGVGYKTAMNLLKSATATELIYFIKNKKVKELSSVFNVGSKANSIVFELENKMDEFENDYIFEYENVYKALINLGYKTQQVKKAIESLKNGLSESEAMRICLKEMNKYGQ